ncbi:MAG TPA: type II secretion system F family protein [Planctomycetota bacterium]|nr:type II secretion system F family protein [Planctomycetota bacterium]
MPVYTYTALDRTGKGVGGTITAEGRAAALELVSAKGLHPVTIDEQAPPSDAPTGGVRGGVRGGRVSQASVETFTRQLANLLAAGVPLSRALHILAREASQPAARRQWTAIHDDVVGGRSLGDSLEKWPRSFPPIYIAMVRAGETGGFLELVLQQIADFRSREHELKGKVVAALVYPIVLATLAAAVLTFLLTYFIPRFSAIFDEFGGALPWLTRAIVAASDLILRRGLVLLAAGAIIVLALRRLSVSDVGRRKLERAILGLPAVGKVVARFALVRFCRMLGTLLGAGVPLVRALRVAREAIGNQTLADTVTQAIEDVQRGAPLARSLAASERLFPASVIEMVAVGEETGRLNEELVRLSIAYEAELDRRLRILVSLAEPALLLIMAGVVGTVVIGMLLPIFTLQDLIR